MCGSQVESEKSLQVSAETNSWQMEFMVTREESREHQKKKKNEIKILPAGAVK